MKALFVDVFFFVGVVVVVLIVEVAVWRCLLWFDIQCKFVVVVVVRCLMFVVRLLLSCLVGCCRSLVCVHCCVLFVCC